MNAGDEDEDGLDEVIRSEFVTCLGKKYAKSLRTPMPGTGGAMPWETGAISPDRGGTKPRNLGMISRDKLRGSHMQIRY